MGLTNDQTTNAASYDRCRLFAEPYAFKPVLTMTLLIPAICIACSRQGIFLAVKACPLLRYARSRETICLSTLLASDWPKAPMSVWPNVGRAFAYRICLSVVEQFNQKSPQQSDKSDHTDQSRFTSRCKGRHHLSAFTHY